MSDPEKSAWTPTPLCLLTALSSVCKQASKWWDKGWWNTEYCFRKNKSSGKLLPLCLFPPSLHHHSSWTRRLSHIDLNKKINRNVFPLAWNWSNFYLLGCLPHSLSTPGKDPSYLLGDSPASPVTKSVCLSLSFSPEWQAHWELHLSEKQLKRH